MGRCPHRGGASFLGESVMATNVLTYLVRPKQPDVVARKVNWNALNGLFARSTSFPDNLIYQQTGHFGPEDFDQVLIDEKECSGGVWLLGPYLDGGFHIVDNLDEFIIINNNEDRLAG